MFILKQYFDGGNMSIDTNSMVSVLKNIVLDTKKINHEQIQQQDAINYIIQDVKVAIKDLLTEVDKIEKTINQEPKKKTWQEKFDSLFDTVILILSAISLLLCFATIIFEFKRLDVFSKIIFSTVCSFSGSQSK